MRLFILSSLVLFVTACVTTSDNFTTEKIMEVRQGMTSDQILTMFGEPMDVRVAVCGEAPSQWNCTTWDYEMFPEGGASFTFSDVEGQLLLNNFDVDRVSMWDY